MKELIEKINGKYIEEKKIYTLNNFKIVSSKITKNIEEAYNKNLSLKFMFDQMEEIPDSMEKKYYRIMKIMDLLRKAKDEAYQNEMEFKRLK